MTDNRIVKLGRILPGSVITFLFSLLISTQSLAQILFEDGYFIDKNDNRVNCLIKNEGWLRTPSSITYKMEPGGEEKVLDKSQMKEFGVRHHKYVRALVQMDTSSQRMKNLSVTRKPFWDTRDVLLKVLVEGKASLYYFDNDDLVLFFYSVEQSPIQQLEYKSYLSRDRSTNELKAGENLTYLNQLQTEVSCGDQSKNLTSFKTKYKLEHLVDYFTRFNQCSQAVFTIYKQDTRKEKKFHLKLSPGASFAASKIEQVTGSPKEFPSRKIIARFGVELEFVLPFNNNKWALFLEPVYQQYAQDGEYTISYTSIETGFGLRHYFYLNDNFKLFVNAGMVADVPTEYSARRGTFMYESTAPKLNFAGGVGASYKKFSIEGRLYSLRTGLDTTGSYYFDFAKSSVIIGYRLF